MNSLDYKREFFRKHGGMLHCDTGSLNEYGNYCKTYTTEDGGLLFEVNGPAYQTEEFTTEGGYTVTEAVKKWKTEIWHSDNANSVIWYTNY